MGCEETSVSRKRVTSGINKCGVIVRRLENPLEDGEHEHEPSCCSKKKCYLNFAHEIKIKSNSIRTYISGRLSAALNDIYPENHTCLCFYGINVTIMVMNSFPSSTKQKHNIRFLKMKGRGAQSDDEVPSNRFSFTFITLSSARLRNFYGKDARGKPSAPRLQVKIQQQEQSLPRVEFHSSQAFFLLDLDVVLDQLFAHPGAQINDVMAAHWNWLYSSGDSEGRGESSPLIFTVAGKSSNEALFADRQLALQLVSLYSTRRVLSNDILLDHIYFMSPAYGVHRRSLLQILEGKCSDLGHQSKLRFQKNRGTKRIRRKATDLYCGKANSLEMHIDSEAHQQKSEMLKQ
nr:unnamed protein product [Callosobruchus chinensis]